MFLFLSVKSLGSKQGSKDILAVFVWSELGTQSLSLLVPPLEVFDQIEQIGFRTNLERPSEAGQCRFFSSFEWDDVEWNDAAAEPDDDACDHDGA